MGPRSLPYVKKPEKGGQETSLPTNDKPCVDCDVLEYKPLFFYGYRAICPSCLYHQFVKYFPDLVPTSHVTRN